ncbi:CAP domain-containing protein [Blastococcus sp. SYSU DS1024]
MITLRTRMHHRPSGPPGARRTAARHDRSGSPRRRSPRVGLAVALTFATTAVVLTAPVVAGSEVTQGPIDASSSTGSAPGSSTSVFPGTAPAAPVAPGDAPDAPDALDALDAPDASAGPVVAEPEPAPAPAEVPGSGETPSPPPPSAFPSATVAAPGSTSRAPAPAAAAAPPPAPPVTPAAPSVEAEVLALVNAQRAQAGCGPVAPDSGLAAVARAHSTGMRDRGFFDHVDPDGLDPFDRAARAGVSARAENIARGQSDPAAVMASWMTSPGHRANILNCGLTRLGVGVATGSGGPWWTQLFG